MIRNTAKNLEDLRFSGFLFLKINVFIKKNLQFRKVLKIN